MEIIERKSQYHRKLCNSYVCYASRPLTQAFLFVIFLLLFGFPAISRYQAKKVMVLTYKKNTGGIQAPTITIAAFNSETKNGWRGNTSMTYDLIAAYCKTNQQSPVEDCIRNNTFRQGEVIKDVILGFTAKRSIMKQENLITEDFLTAWDGILYGVNLNQKIGPNDSLDQLYVFLATALMYQVFIHDPNYFIVNENPAGLPSIMLELNPNISSNYHYRISLTEVQEVDLPEDPCNSDPTYNFQARRCYCDIVFCCYCCCCCHIPPP